jgi:hypothetical protein
LISTSPDGKPHNQIDHILVNRRRKAFECTWCSIIQSSRLYYWPLSGGGES